MSSRALIPTLKRYGKGARFLIVLLCSVVVLAGCGNGTSTDSDDDGRRFASERIPTSEPTATSDASEVTQEPLPTVQPTTSPDELLNLRGAPQFAYFVIEDRLQVYDTASHHFTQIDLADDFVMLDFASSPTGDRVGILGIVERRLVVQFHGADGEPLGNAIPLTVGFQPIPVPVSATPVASPIATPTADRPQSQLRVNWVPQGNAVVVTGPGILQRVSMSGTVMPISRAGVTGMVVDAYWSPMDSQLAIVTRQMDGSQSVFLLDSGHAEARELEVLQIQPYQVLSNLQWSPNGLGLLVVVGTENEGDLMNGQLWVYKFDDGEPRLLATSGQGGPTGTLTHVAISPDGHSVAYAVMVRDQGTWHLHSLWVKSVQDGTVLQIPLISNQPIIELIWTAEGLVWQQEDGRISVVDSNLEPRPLGDEPQATPVVSPQSTPITDPTPRG